jgi:pimeloyl-ACP methyl ester carboxylesterase
MPVSLNGTAYEVHGPADAPVILLIHGLGLTRGSTWQPMLPALSAEFRVVAYDLCGHGETALPEKPVSLTLLSEQVILLMDELGIASAALVGFSLGGMINRRCAMDHPDRVSALVILNSPHERGEEQQRLVEERARDTSAGGPAANIDATLARWFTEGFRRDHADKVAAVKGVVLANDHTNYAAHRQVLAEGVKELIRPDPPITHPALVMTCENDTGSTPVMSRAIGSEIEGSEVIIVPALQHLGLIEQPGAFSGPIIDYLRRTLG